MDAIEMLEEQHRQLEELFGDIELAEAPAKSDLFHEIVDRLTVHALIEERHFYPAVNHERTEELVHQAAEEHAGMKRLLADMLRLDVEDEHFEAKLDLLREVVESHVEEEELLLFPRVRKVLDRGELEALCEAMMATQEELARAGSLRRLLLGVEEDRAAPL